MGIALILWSGPRLLRHDPLDEPRSGQAEGRTPHHIPWHPIVLIGLPTTAMWLTDSATSVWSGIYLGPGLLRTLALGGSLDAGEPLSEPPTWCG